MWNLDLDFKKSFYKVDNNILLAKLTHYGVGEIEHNWFKIYLVIRKLHVTVNSQTSENTLTEFGVTQGSVPGLLLSFIYINDQNQATKLYTILQTIRIITIYL